MSRHILPIAGPLIGDRFGCAGFVGSEVVGGFCDPHPPGEAERLAKELTAEHGDPIQNLRRLHATPCRASFPGTDQA
jgi:hypothetical protein